MKSGGMLVMISLPALVLAILGFFALRALAKKYKAKLQPIVDKLSKALFFSIFIRSTIIAYVSLCVSAKYGSLFYQESKDEPLNTPFALIVCAVIAATFHLAFYVEKEELDSEETTMRIGSAYQGLKTNNTACVFNTCFFFIRRLLFVMALQCRIFSVQYGGIMNLVVFNICWLADVRPHKERAMTILETFNEIFLLISLYALPLFTDWVTDAKIQYKYGWVFVYTLGPLFMINIGFVVMLAVEMVLKKFKMRFLTKMIKEKK